MTVTAETLMAIVISGKNTGARADEVNERFGHVQGVWEWLRDPDPKLRRPDSSIWHKLVGATKGEGAVINSSSDNDYLEAFVSEPPHIFLVDHDWGAVFEGAADFAEGEYRLPYDRCIFEFLLGGRRACVTAHQEDGGTPRIVVWVAEKTTWVGLSAVDSAGKPTPTGAVIVPTIRAICIALDAEVAVIEPVRAPHKLNRAREKAGKRLLPDFNIVKLRQQRTRTLPSENEPTGQRKRLHFRRGHWRHLNGFKTWIRWCLVGDPDMDFVDKLYRS